MLSKLIDNYDSEQDENYEPTKKENLEYQKEHMRKIIKKSGPSKNIHELYLQMKKDYQDQTQQQLTNKRRSTEENLKDTEQLAASILNSDSIKPNKKITFAGKQYLLNEETGQLELIQKVRQQNQTVDAGDIEKNPDFQKQMQIRDRHISYQYLNHIMQAIYYRSKKINAIGKSKLDWKGFVKQEGIESKLEYNRKGGIIQNMQFMKNAP